MKRLALGILAIVASLVLADVSWAVSISDYPNGVAANGIAGSRHNLGRWGFAITTNFTTEICVFCHTPHHGSPDTGPLWNRQNALMNFTPYGTTLAGTAVGDPGGATLACLSCHDGVTTFDSLINTPGKGNGFYGILGKTAVDRSWIFQMPGGLVAASGLDHFGQQSCNFSVCHGPNDPNGGVRLNIGTATGSLSNGSSVVLTDDHPVSVAYTAGKASLRPTSVTLSSIDLTAGLNATGAADANLQQNRWAVNGSISDSVTIASLLKGGKVECSSCHDPHFKNLSWDEVDVSTWDANPLMFYCSGENCSDGNFLRRVGGNTGSGVCRTCHNK